MGPEDIWVVGYDGGGCRPAFKIPEWIQSSRGRELEDVSATIGEAVGAFDVAAIDRHAVEVAVAGEKEGILGQAAV
jgi:hypothetical protein